MPVLSPEPPSLSGSRSPDHSGAPGPSLTASPKNPGPSKLQNLFIEQKGEAPGDAGEGWGTGRRRAGGPWVRTLGVTGPAAPALPAQTAKVRSLLGPLSGASHSRVPHLLIPLKGRVSGFCHRSFCNHGNTPPRRPPPPVSPPYRAPQGPSHCPQGLTTSLAGGTAP